MENIYEMTHTVEATQTDPTGRLLPAMALRLAQQVAGEHCDRISLSYGQLTQQGMFWAVVRNRLQIRRMPTVGEQILLRTWPMPTTRTAYPRATEALDAQGQLLFRSVSLWVLMDLRARTMILPGKSAVTVEGTVFGTELEAPRSLSPLTEGQRQLRQVDPEDLDRNGHMNNARYLDWVWDLLPGDFPAADMTLCYIQEALEGQTLELIHSFRDRDTFCVDIRRGPDRIFSAQLRSARYGNALGSL